VTAAGDGRTMNGSNQQSSWKRSPVPTGRLVVTWLALFVQLASGPLAAISHRHDHGDDSCCAQACPAAGDARPGRNAAAADVAAGRSCQAAPHACRFSRCRDASGQAAPTDIAAVRDADPGAAVRPAVVEGAGGPVFRSGTAKAPCLACQFLAKHVAVAAWTWCDSSFLARWDEPAVHPIRVAAPLVAAFLARGPPA
jgi:hypothetical protein